MTALGQAEVTELGLRERKKARTRTSIQQHAMLLFRDQGYDATTVEQIAAAAEVSASTFFRYFPTKEDVVIRDDYDRLLLEAFRDQPSNLNPVQAVRAAVRELGISLQQLTPEELSLERDRATLQMSVPEIRARSIDEFLRAFWVFADAVAERVGSRPEAMPVRAFVGALLGVMIGAYLPRTSEAADTEAWHLGPDLVQRMEDALALLEAGLPL
ncbi:MAG: TetR family transcriptional regulator [Candidatus Dormibacteria bacterium]|jgi:AcrR family transcriptional regulator